MKVNNHRLQKKKSDKNVLNRATVLVTARPSNYKLVSQSHKVHNRGHHSKVGPGEDETEDVQGYDLHVEAPHLHALAVSHSIYFTETGQHMKTGDRVVTSECMNLRTISPPVNDLSHKGIKLIECSWVVVTELKYKTIWEVKKDVLWSQCAYACDIQPL